MPASGALKMPATPPAQPAAIYTFIRRPETRSRCPTCDPSAPPICAIGPSTPADPPEPMVRAVLIILMAMERALRTPFSG